MSSFGLFILYGMLYGKIRANHLFGVLARRHHVIFRLVIINNFIMQTEASALVGFPCVNPTYKTVSPLSRQRFKTADAAIDNIQTGLPKLRLANVLVEMGLH